MAKKHSERMPKKFKASREHRDTFVEDPIASETTSAGTAFETIAPSKPRRLTIFYSSSISTTKSFLSISFPHISLQGFSLPSTTLSYNVPYFLKLVPYEPIHTSTPQSSNPNIIIPSPSPSTSEILTSIISPTPQPILPSFSLS